MIKFKLLSIDAWRDPEGWCWNTIYLLENSLEIDEAILTPRKIAAFLRRRGFLSHRSVGRIRVDMHPEIADGHLIEIRNKSKNKPLFVLSTIH